MPITQGKLDYATRSSFLELDKAFAGQLVSVDGGDAMAVVMEETPSSDLVVRKRVAGVHYTDIELECDAAMERSFFEWIQDTLKHKFTRKSGAISFLDGGTEPSKLEFSNALVTGVSFPALDAGSKDATTMTVTLSPEYTRRLTGVGQARSAPVGPNRRGAWTPANFKLQIDGLDCEAVNTVESLTLKAVIPESDVGERREYEKEPVRLHVPDLVITLPASKAATFHAWHEDFVIKGLNGPAYEKNGVLELLSPNMKDVLLTLRFKNLGIFRLAPVKAPSGSGIALVRASMYCEQITLNDGSVAPPQPPDDEPAELAIAGRSHDLTGGRREVVDLRSDPRNCGRLGNDITNLFPNATALCVDGQPQMGECKPGYVDADGIAANGCELYVNDGVATHPHVPTSLGTLVRGGSLTASGVRGPAKPAWWFVTMPCNDSCAARLSMRNGPAFDVFGPTFQTSLARGVTTYDAHLSPALTQLWVCVPEGPWASYTLSITRE
jgi:hypothetical protein